MDPELREALRLSMQDANPPPAAAAPEAAPAAPAGEEPPAKKAKAEDEKEGNMNAMFQDLDFVQDLLGGLPGVDMQDARIQEALKAVGVPTEEKKDEEKKDD